MEKLSQSEKNECVGFMLKVLKETDEFYKSSLTSLTQLKNELYVMMDADTRENAEITKQVADLMTKRQIEKEDKLQNKVLSGNDRQLLFSDIYTTYTHLDEAKESVEKAIQLAQEVVTKGVNSISSNKLAYLISIIPLLYSSKPQS